jgi:hypothetical protein
MEAIVELIRVSVLIFRRLPLPISAMYKEEIPSKAQPLIPLKCAFDPTPSSEPQLEVIVVLDHTHGGCALNPATVQAVTG